MARARHLAGATDAGRVDDAELLLVPLQDRVDRVPRGARHLADDHPLFLEQPVDQRRLADVGPADDGDLGLDRILGRLGLGDRQPAGHGVEQIADARSVLRRDRHDRVEAQRVELDHAGLRLAIVGLVDGDDHRPAALPDGRGDLFVAGHQTVLAVGDEHDQIGRRDRAMALLKDELVQRILAGAEHAAGVDDGDVRTLPFGLGGDDVAGGAGDRRDDGAPRPGDAIEQRRLADIRPADEDDGSISGGFLAGHDRLGTRMCGDLRLVLTA
jgi:hypothetical protein